MRKLLLVYLIPQQLFHNNYPKVINVNSLDPTIVKSFEYLSIVKNIYTLFNSKKSLGIKNRLVFFNIKPFSIKKNKNGTI